MTPNVEFSNGQKIPIVGLGLLVRKQTDLVETLEASLNAALEIGYRHFDTAFMYKNESIVGPVFKKWIDSGKLRREDLFITTKLPMNGMHADRVQRFLKKSLTALQLDYVDLYLVHNPTGMEYTTDDEVCPIRDGKVLLDKSTDLESVWKAMEKQVDAGLAKGIGISNFNSEQIERIVKIARIQPQNLQVECNVYFQQKNLREVCKKHGITVCAYGAIGSPGRKELYADRGLTKEFFSLLDDPVVHQVAKKYGKSTGQILLRYLTQLNIIIIPTSTNPERLRHNFEIFDFTLKSEDMSLLAGLDKGEAGRSFVFVDLLPGMDEHPEYPF